jgi:hypothetical protein
MKQTELRTLKLNQTVKVRLQSSTTTSTTLPVDELTITINEIMYNPSASQGPDDRFEYIELYNYGSTPIDLKGWILMDSGSDAETLESFNNTATVVPSHGYAIVTDEDSNLTLTPGFIRLSTGDGSICTSGLSNAGEQLRLYDPYGREIDSIEYLPSWGGNGNGMSLEKRQPEEENEQYNWGESRITYGTPGERNSVYGYSSQSGVSTTSTTTTTTMEGCVDGTALGECSFNKPKYCFDGILVLRCSKCGCPHEYDCVEDECVKKTNQTTEKDIEKEAEAKNTYEPQMHAVGEETMAEKPVEVRKKNAEPPGKTTTTLRQEEDPAKSTTTLPLEDARETQSILSGYSVLSKAADPKVAGTITLSLILGVYLLKKRRPSGGEAGT